MEAGAERLIDWKQQTSNSLRRCKYDLVSLSDTDTFCDVVRYSYNKGVLSAKEKCQLFFFLQVGERGSIVCDECIPAARYSLCSTADTLITSFHVHAESLATCLYCNRRIKALDINKCKSFPQICKLFITEKQWISRIK